MEKANQFNKHFVSTSSTRPLYPVSEDHSEFFNLIDFHEFCLFLYPVTTKEGLAIIKKMKNKRSTEIDVLKACALELAEILKVLANKPSTQEVFPKRNWL
ncbi:hypothetical protein JTB14_009748 [Gonioctena quinquepunctata]|nr:hypothetical protein JTB14_009748 [Gonioctena quinquepunctata]